MGLIERIKSALGLGTSASTSQPRPGTADGPTPGESTAGEADDDGVDVTVEHEPATASEDAVKGTDTSDAASPAAPETTDADDTDADDGDADDSDADDSGDTTAVEATAESAAAEDTDTDSESSGSDADLEEITGIGPTYADRLRDAGVADVGDLAVADADDLAERADVPAGRAADWVERAAAF